MPLSDAQRARNALGAQLRSDPTADVTELRLDLDVAMLRERLRQVEHLRSHIRELVAAAPRAGDQLRHDLQVLLHPEGQQ